MQLVDPTDQASNLSISKRNCCGMMTKEKLELNSDNPARSDEELDKIVLATSAALARIDWVGVHLTPTGDDQQAHVSTTTAATSTIEEAADAKTSAELNRLLQPKRPMNAFMVWGQSIRRELHNRYTNVQNAMLSKSLGRVWKQLNMEEKRPYMERASAIKANHKRDYPNYRYQPRRIQEKHFRQQQQQQQQEAMIRNDDLLHDSLALDACSSSESSIGFQQAPTTTTSPSASSIQTATVDDLQGCVTYTNQTHCMAPQHLQYIGQQVDTNNNCATIHHHAQLNYDAHPNGSIIYYSQTTTNQEHPLPSADCHSNGVCVEPRQQQTVLHYPIQYQSYEQQAPIASGITHSISGQLSDGYACNTDTGHMEQVQQTIEPFDPQQRRLFDYQQRVHVDESAGW